MPTKVTVFIGWSGPRSKAVARAFADWLPNVIQATEPWLSEDIYRGAQWFATIGVHLRAADYGLLCVTPENRDQPWVLFEAGALAIHTNEHLACPYLLDMTDAELTGPLVQLQAATATREGTFKVVETINRLLDEPVRLSSERLSNSFETWWPKLEEELAKARQLVAARPAPPVRSTDDKIEEVLEIVRAMQRSQSQGSSLRITSESPFVTSSLVNTPLGTGQHGLLTLNTSGEDKRPYVIEVGKGADFIKRYVAGMQPLVIHTDQPPEGAKAAEPPEAAKALTRRVRGKIGKRKKRR